MAGAEAHQIQPENHLGQQRVLGLVRQRLGDRPLVVLDRDEG